MLPLPLVEGGVLGVLRIPEEPELLAPEPELMLLEPELECELLRSRSRQVCNCVPVIPWQAVGMVLEVPEDELVLGEVTLPDRLEDDPDPMDPFDPEPMLDPPGVAPLEPPMPPELLPVPCAQANCASARAETAHALTSIREVVPICARSLCVN